MADLFDDRNFFQRSWDKVKGWWDTFTLWFIPSDYVIKIKILRRLYGQHLYAKSWGQSHYIENVGLTPSELADSTNLTVEQINLHHFDLLSKSEISIARETRNNEVKHLWIDAKGIQAIGNDKYYWEGLEARIKRLNLIWIVSGGVILSTVLCKTDAISTIKEQLSGKRKHKEETTISQESHNRTEISSKAQTIDKVMTIIPETTSNSNLTLDTPKVRN